MYHPPASLKLKRADVCVGPIQADLGPDHAILSLRKGVSGRGSHDCPVELERSGASAMNTQHLLIHSPSKYLLSTYYVPGVQLGTQTPVFLGQTFQK